MGAVSARPSTPEPLDRDQPLHELGTPPDERFTFANERTFLAWNRTSLALMAAGLAAAQLLRLGFRGAVLMIALPLIGLGTVLALTSYRRWEDNERRLRMGKDLPYSQLPRLLAAGIVVIALMSMVLVVLDVSMGGGG